MTINEPTARKPIRLWPGVVLAALLVLVRFVLPPLFPAASGMAALGGLVGGLLIVIWWLFFSRAPWVERVGAVVLMVVATFATWFIVHDSIRGGMMGMMLPVYLAIPGLALALVAWAAASRGLTPESRRAALVAAILIACGAFTLIRTDGIVGEGVAQLKWRWTPTAEQRLLAQAPDLPVDSRERTFAPAPAPPPTPAPEAAVAAVPPAAATATTSPASPGTSGAAVKPAVTATAVTPSTGETMAGAAPVSDPGAGRAEWPGFRGPDRDGVVRGVRIETDWAKSPPVGLWRRPIGPGWASFAVQGDRIYTQEQRGDDEIVSCYQLTTGKPVWSHRDGVRFYESNGGAGPRGTPTLSGGRVYTLGATGLVNALDAATGAVVWSRNAAADSGAQLPAWGFTSSPLVVDDVVVVAASGRLAAYDAASGKLRWTRPTGGGGYSSPHPLTIDGVRQILLLSSNGATSIAPADGAVLWTHMWDGGVAIVQPAATVDGDMLISVADAMGGFGVRRIGIAHTSSGWTTEERWTSRGLKPYFNDYVVHKGHAYGFDGTILSSIDLTDGTRKWKGGRYGAGQMVLLADQDLLLVLSEEGELALVKATPDQFTEVARMPAIEGKTWNHPVLVGDVLLVRNGQEMAAFRLPLAGR